ncbi:MAG: tetratricopeptide repeat protein [Bacteroidota bacterium]
MSDQSNTLKEEFKLLLRAVRAERPRMLLVQYNHYDLVRRTLRELAETYPDRAMHRFDFSQAVPTYLSKEILACEQGFVLLEHFEQLFKAEHQAQVLTFNQRRDAFSRQPLILLIFLPWGLEVLKTFRDQLPDTYSIINPIIQLQQDIKTNEARQKRMSSVENLEGVFDNSEEAQAEIRRLLDRLATLEESEENAALKSSLQNDLALAYQFIGRYEEAATLLETALQSDLDNFGKQHLEVAKKQSNLALVYSDLGRYEKAANLLETALQSDLDNFGKQHPEVAKKQSNLALVYSDLGRYEEAANLLEVSLQSDLDNFGEKHPKVAARQSNLAIVYQDLGLYEESAQLLQAALQSDLENFGEKHPNVAVRQSNLAAVYRNLGRYEEAARLLEAALQSALENFEEQHPKVAVSQSNLATVYRNLDRYEEAAQLLQAALQSDLDNFGEQHPTVAITLNNLALVNAAQKQYQQALENWLKALEILQRNFLESHPYIEILNESIARTLKEGAAAGDAYCQERWERLSE